MPIKKSKKHLYPANWKQIATEKKNEANWQCEWCGVKHEITDMAHCLTVHHRDRNPANCSSSNLVALCARCHLKEEARLRRIEHDKARGQLLIWRTI